MPKQGQKNVKNIFFVIKVWHIFYINFLKAFQKIIFISVALVTKKVCAILDHRPDFLSHFA